MLGWSTNCRLQWFIDNESFVPIGTQRTDRTSFYIVLSTIVINYAIVHATIKSKNKK